MNMNFLFKKFFLIAALGGFCMPAQGMWSSVWNSTKKCVTNPYVVGFVSGVLVTVGVYKAYEKYQREEWNKKYAASKLQCDLQAQQEFDFLKNIIISRDLQALQASYTYSSFERLLFASVHEVIDRGENDLSYRCLECLLENNVVDVNTRDQTCYNQTPLMAAVCCSGTDSQFTEGIVKLLLDHGADFTLVDDHRMSVLDLAINSRNIDGIVFFMKMSEKKEFDKAYQYLCNSGALNGLEDAPKKLLNLLHEFSEGDYSKLTLKKCSYFLVYPLLHDIGMKCIADVESGKDISYVVEGLVSGGNTIDTKDMWYKAGIMLHNVYSINSWKHVAHVFSGVKDFDFCDEFNKEFDKLKSTPYVHATKYAVTLQTIRCKVNEQFLKNIVLLQQFPMVDVYWRFSSKLE